MDAESRRSLGATIKACRRELGWTQEELAERVAAHGDWTFRQCDVSRLERRVVTLPHRERLIHISAVLGVPLGELLARSGWAGADTAFPDAEEISPAKTVIAAPRAPDDILEEASFTDARES
jgi:transcriptional regulator with XRE-family HTH domain